MVSYFARICFASGFIYAKIKRKLDPLDTHDRSCSERNVYFYFPELLLALIRSISFLTACIPWLRICSPIRCIAILFHCILPESTRARRAWYVTHQQNSNLLRVTFDLFKTESGLFSFLIPLNRARTLIEFRFQD